MLSTASESALRTKACKGRFPIDLISGHRDIRNKESFFSNDLNDYLKLFRCGQGVWMSQYRSHNAAVKALVPPSQLLVYKVGEGWERLCQFLQVEVPHSAFPHENKAGQAGNIVEKYLKYQVFRQAESEVRRAFLTLGLGLSVTVSAGWLLLNMSLRLTEHGGTHEMMGKWQAWIEENVIATGLEFLKNF